MHSKQARTQLQQWLDRLSQFLPAMIVGIILSIGFAVSSVAQDDQGPQDQEIRMLGQEAGSCFLPPPREVVQPLIRALRSIEEGEPGRAVLLIGEFLATPPREDYLVSEGQHPGLSISLRQRAEQMLGGLPVETLQTYEMRFGIPARQALDRATAQTDLGLLRDVTQRYFLTSAGTEATMLLGHQYLDRGQLLPAAACFSRVKYSPAPSAQSYEPEVTILLATCWMLDGHRERARETLAEWNRNTSNSSIVFNGRRVPMFERDDQALDWLSNLIGDSPLIAARPVREWLMQGGQPNRNAAAAGGFPFGAPAWVTKTSADPDSREEELSFQSSFSRSSTGAIAVTTALAVGDRVVLKTPQAMIGIDFETGRRLWEYPSSVREVAQQLDGSAAESDSLGMQVAWQDALHGQCSSDGELIFAIPDRMVAFPLERDGRVSMVETNQLHAISLDQQGALKWSLGGKQSPSDPSLQGARFLGPPLPLEGDLLVIANIEQEIRLIALDKQTGKVQWQQHLAEVANVRSQLATINYSLSPSYTDGVLVCPTGQGALVAIDYFSRRLLWGMQFEPNLRRSNRLNWAPGKLVLEDELAVFASQESGNLYAFELETGLPVDDFGRSGLPAASFMDLACVYHRNAVLVGKSQVEAFSLNDRTSQWSVPIDAYGAPSGRGYRDGKFLYLPTLDQFVVKIDLDSGKLVDAVETGQTLGNLLPFRGRVLAHSPAVISCFETEAVVREKIAAAVKRSGSADRLDTRQRIQFASLQARQGNWTTARDVLLTLDPDVGVRVAASQLAGLLRQMLDKNVAGCLEVFDRFIDDMPAEERQLLRLQQVNYLVEQRLVERALLALSEWADQSKTEGTFYPPPLPEELEPEMKVEIPQYLIDSNPANDDPDVSNQSSRRQTISFTRSAWFRSCLHRMYRHANLEQRQQIKAFVNRRVQAAADSSFVELEKLVGCFPLYLVDAQTRFELSRRYMEAENHPQAERVLDSLCHLSELSRAEIRDEQGEIKFDFGSEPTTSEVSVDHLQLLLRLLIQQHRYAEIQLLKHAVEQNVLTIAGRQIVDWSVLADEETIVDSTTNEDPPYNDVAVDVEPKEAVYQSNQMLPVKVQGRRFDRLGEQSFVSWHQSHELEVLDAFGVTTKKFPLRRYPTGSSSVSVRSLGQIRPSGSLAVFKRGWEFVCLDANKLIGGNGNPVLWNRFLQGRTFRPKLDGNDVNELDLAPYDSTGYEIPCSDGSHNGICYYDGRRISCVDPVSGREYWQRTMTGNLQLLGDHRNLIVVDWDQRQVKIFDVVSGQKSRQYKLPEDCHAIWDSDGAVAILLGDREGGVKAAASETITGDFASVTIPTAASNAPGVAGKQFVAAFDFLNQSYLWRRSVPDQACVARMSRLRLAFLDPEGELAILDGRSGNQLAATRPAFNVERGAIQNMGAMKVGDQQMLIFNQIDARTSNQQLNKTLRAYRINNTERLIRGDVMLLADQSLQPVWKEGAMVHLNAFSPLPFVPNASPVLLFHRRVQPTSAVLSNVRKAQQVVAISQATGELLMNRLMPNYQARFLQPIRWSSEKNELSLNLVHYSGTITFKRSDDMPPRPLAMIGANNAVPMSAYEEEPAKPMLDTDRLKAINAKIRQQILGAGGGESPRQ